MGKFNLNSPSVSTIVTTQAVNHPLATTNKAGGLAYSLDGDQSTKLLTMTGGQFFNEPSYYTSDKVGVDGLTELARNVVESAKLVAGTNTPKDVLSIANFLRNEKNIRTTPAVLYAIAAGQETNRENMIEYGPKILKRADEVLQSFAAYFALYGKFDVKGGRVTRVVTLPNSFKKGLAAALSKFDEYQLVKWDNNEWPRFRDVLQVVYRRKNYPVNQSLLTYFITGEVADAAQTPIIAARKELNSLTQWSAVVPEMAKKAHVTWEEMLSKFGNKKEVWEALIDGGRATLPVMAAVRNLRNMEQAGISTAHWAKVRDLILSHSDNKMMPFRFISARKAVTSAQALSIADLLLDKASMNIQDIPGLTCILPDNSGSMNSLVSAKSEMTKREVANSLAAVLAKRLGDRACIAAFGTRPIPVVLSLADSTYRNYQEIENVGSRTGGSTEGGAAIRHLTTSNTFVDRIIMLSDMQCYTRGSSAGNVQPALAEYKAKVNPNVKFISVDIGGHGDSQVAPDKNVWLSTGMNESIVTEILAFEGILTDNVSVSDGTLSLSMEYVRANF